MTPSTAAAGTTIEFRSISKHFGAVRAVDGLTFTVEPGVVTGFLGPNGAGKTTSLRMLLGLVQPSGGSATFGGVAYRDLDDPLGTVGTALEASSFHPGRTARNHLRVYAATAINPAVRDTALLIPDATPACRSSTAVITVVVSGATASDMPMLITITAGKTPTQ